jgi:hypothetical protein
MAGRQPQAVLKRLSNLSLAVFCILFLVFTANILLGKARAALGWDVLIRLSDVGEYLVLLSAAFFFTVASLLRECQGRDSSSPSDPDRTVNQP